MQKSNFFKCVKNIHFIGISGVSMSALAKFSAQNGKKVTGSDLNFDKEEFFSFDIKVYKGHSAKNVLGADAVIYTSAISDNNEELLEAKKNNIPLIRRGQFLGMVLGGYKKTIAVSGSHGKTTATAMLSHVLIRAGKDPTCFIGGKDLTYGNFYLGKGDIAVTEACEYQKNFLDIFPNIAVVLNIDNDHLDCYGSIENEIVTFSDFVKNTLAVINADDKNCRFLFQNTTVSFGINSPACYTAYNLKKRDGERYSFSVRAYSAYRGRVNLAVLGKHNVYNALAVIAVCETLGVKFKDIKKGLENFKGVERRSEIIGEYKNLLAVCDYAHHPTEIRETIKTFLAQKETIVVFEPHTYSRTKNLMDEFVDVFSDCEKLIIYKTYPAREPFDKDGSSYVLYRNLCKGQSVLYAKSHLELENAIEKLSGGVKKILFLGAGEIYQRAKKLVNDKKYENKS